VEELEAQLEARLKEEEAEKEKRTCDRARQREELRKAMERLPPKEQPQEGQKKPQAPEALPHAQQPQEAGAGGRDRGHQQQQKGPGQEGVRDLPAPTAREKMLEDQLRTLQEQLRTLQGQGTVVAEAVPGPPGPQYEAAPAPTYRQSSTTAGARAIQGLPWNRAAAEARAGAEGSRGSRGSDRSPQ